MARIIWWMNGRDRYVWLYDEEGHVREIENSTARKRCKSALKRGPTRSERSKGNPRGSVNWGPRINLWQVRHVGPSYCEAFRHSATSSLWSQLRRQGISKQAEAGASMGRARIQSYDCSAASSNPTTPKNGSNPATPSTTAAKAESTWRPTANPILEPKRLAQPSLGCDRLKRGGRVEW
jgi:hypothetical protein